MNNDPQEYPYNSAGRESEFGFLDDEMDASEEVLKNGFYEYEAEGIDSVPFDCFLDAVRDIDKNNEPRFEVAIRVPSPLEEVFTCSGLSPYHAAIGCIQMAKKAYKDLMAEFGPSAAEL